MGSSTELSELPLDPPHFMEVFNVLIDIYTAISKKINRDLQ